MPSFAGPKAVVPSCGSWVRQLALRASLESVGDSDRKRVAWSLYEHEIPAGWIPRARGNKGMIRISLDNLDYM